MGSRGTVYVTVHVGGPQAWAETLLGDGQWSPPHIYLVTLTSLLGSRGVTEYSDRSPSPFPFGFQVIHICLVTVP